MNILDIKIIIIIIWNATSFPSQLYNLGLLELYVCVCGGEGGWLCEWLYRVDYKKV